MASNLLFKVRKALNRDRKHWPVTVRKYELFENGELQEKSDRGRRKKSVDGDEWVYEFLHETDETASIPRQYLKKDENGHTMLEVLKVQTSEGPQFAPVKKELEVDRSDFEDDENLPEEVKVEFIIKLSRFIQIGKNELEKHYEITKNENKEWYQAPIVWLVMGAVGMGLFYVLAGIGAQKMLSGVPEAAAPLLALKKKNWRGG